MEKSLDIEAEKNSWHSAVVVFMLTEPAATGLIPSISDFFQRMFLSEKLIDVDQVEQIHLALVSGESALQKSSSYPAISNGAEQVDSLNTSQ